MTENIGQCVGLLRAELKLLFEMEGRWSKIFINLHLLLDRFV